VCVFAWLYDCVVCMCLCVVCSFFGLCFVCVVCVGVCVVCLSLSFLRFVCCVCV